ncbi:MAG TPA: hypothetical protein VGD21_01700, partial [Lysobacter sp.]
MKTILLAAAALLALPNAAVAADTLRWPSPWEAGLSLVYETESLDSEAKAGQREKIRTTDTTEVTISQASADGYLQEWRSRDLGFEVIEGDKAAGALREAAVRAMADSTVEVALDKNGNYASIRNLDALSTRMREVMRPLIVASIEAEVGKLDEGKRDKARAEALKGSDGILDRITSPAMLEPMLGRVLQTYNGFVGVDLEIGEWYELETAQANPLGGKPFPSKLQFQLYPSEDDPNDVFLEWNSSVDPDKGADAMWELTEKLVGKKIPPKERKALPDTVAIKDEGFFLFRRDTGIVEMYESVRTIKLGDHEKVERQRMR